MFILLLLLYCCLYDKERPINDRRFAQTSCILIWTPIPQVCFDSSHTVSAHGKEAQVRRQECFTRARRSEDDPPIDASAVRHGNPRCRQSGAALLLFYHYYFLRWRKHQTVQSVVSRATPALTEIEFVWIC